MNYSDQLRVYSHIRSSKQDKNTFYQNAFIYKYQWWIRWLMFEYLGACFLGYGLNAAQGRDFYIQLTIFCAMTFAMDFSQSHYHLMVTIILMCRPEKKIPVKRGLFQLTATICGLFTGAILCHLILGVHGCNQLQSHEIKWVIADLMSEILATFHMQFWNIHMMEKSMPNQLQTTLLTVFAVFIGRKLSPRTGGCINPSVGIAFHLATAVIERRIDLLQTDLWVFILGPTIGSYLAYKTYHTIIKPCSPLLK